MFNFLKFGRILVLSAAYSAALRLLYIFQIKSLGSPEDFNSYVLVISIFAVVTALISPIDGMVSRFTSKYDNDELLGYILFHSLVRCVVVIAASLICIYISPVLNLFDPIVIYSIFLGILGSILSNLIYIFFVGRGVENWGVRLYLLLPIGIKCFIFFLCSLLDWSFDAALILTELVCFVICLAAVVNTVYRLYPLSSDIFSWRLSYRFIEELKSYGVQGFALIPVSYVKVNLAPAIAATSLSADETFLVVLAQRGIDHLKLFLSKPQLLMSGLNSANDSLIGSPSIWIAGALLVSIGAYYFNLVNDGLVVFYISIRLADVLLYFASYRILGNYLKLEAFSGYNRYVFFPEMVFLFLLMTVELSLINFTWLFLLRGWLGFFSWQLFARRN